MIDITPLMEGIITVLCGIISVYLIPLIRSKNVQFWVNVAVEFAQQTKKDAPGKERKSLVVEWLEKHKIKYDANKLDAMIESSVYRLTNKSTVKIDEKK